MDDRGLDRFVHKDKLQAMLAALSNPVYLLGKLQKANNVKKVLNGWSIEFAEYGSFADIQNHISSISNPVIMIMANSDWLYVEKCSNSNALIFGETVFLKLASANAAIPWNGKSIKSTVLKCTTFCVFGGTEQSKVTKTLEFNNGIVTDNMTCPRVIVAYPHVAVTESQINALLSLCEGSFSIYDNTFLLKLQADSVHDKIYDDLIKLKAKKFAVVPFFLANGTLNESETRSCKKLGILMSDRPKNGHVVFVDKEFDIPDQSLEYMLDLELVYLNKAYITELGNSKTGSYKNHLLKPDIVTKFESRLNLNNRRLFMHPSLKTEEKREVEDIIYRLLGQISKDIANCHIVVIPDIIVVNDKMNKPTRTLNCLRELLQETHMGECCDYLHTGITIHKNTKNELCSVQIELKIDNVKLMHMATYLLGKVKGIGGGSALNRKAKSVCIVDSEKEIGNHSNYEYVSAKYILAVVNGEEVKLKDFVVTSANKFDEIGLGQDSLSDNSEKLSDIEASSDEIKFSYEKQTGLTQWKSAKVKIFGNEILESRQMIKIRLQQFLVSRFNIITGLPCTLDRNGTLCLNIDSSFCDKLTVGRFVVFNNDNILDSYNKENIVMISIVLPVLHQSIKELVSSTYSKLRAILRNIGIPCRLIVDKDSFKLYSRNSKGPVLIGTIQYINNESCIGITLQESLVCCLQGHWNSYYCRDVVFFCKLHDFENCVYCNKIRNEITSWRQIHASLYYDEKDLISHSWKLRINIVKRNFFVLTRLGRSSQKLYNITEEVVIQAIHLLENEAQESVIDLEAFCMPCAEARNTLPGVLFEKESCSLCRTREADRLSGQDEPEEMEVDSVSWQNTMAGLDVKYIFDAFIQENYPNLEFKQDFKGALEKLLQKPFFCKGFMLFFCESIRQFVLVKLGVSNVYFYICKQQGCFLITNNHEEGCCQHKK